MMIVIDTIKVDMPKNKVYVAKSGKSQIKYVYYILKSYRNKKNQPTGKIVSIGRYDEISNKLIPNDNFFKYFNCEITINVKGEKEYGK